MRKATDRRFDWVPALALIAGAAVMAPSLVVLVISLVTALQKILG